MRIIFAYSPILTRFTDIKFTDFTYFSNLTFHRHHILPKTFQRINICSRLTAPKFQILDRDLDFLREIAYTVM